MLVTLFLLFALGFQSSDAKHSFSIEHCHTYDERPPLYNQARYVFHKEENAVEILELSKNPYLQTTNMDFTHVIISSANCLKNNRNKYEFEKNPSVYIANISTRNPTATYHIPSVNNCPDNSGKQYEFPLRIRKITKDGKVIFETSCDDIFDANMLIANAGTFMLGTFDGKYGVRQLYFDPLRQGRSVYYKYPWEK